MKTGGHTWAVFCVCYMCCVDADRYQYEDWRPHLGSLLCVLEATLGQSSVCVTCVVLMLTGLSMKTGGHTWAVFCVCYMCCVDADRSEYEDWRPHLGSLLCVLHVLC